jgi:hypothetical protein
MEPHISLNYDGASQEDMYCRALIKAEISGENQLHSPRKDEILPWQPRRMRFIAEII